VLGSRPRQPLTGKLYRVGYLATGTANSLLQGAFLQGMREIGWIEGQNFVLEYRFAEGAQDRLPALADEMVRLGVDTIVASPTASAIAAKQATGTIPIVGIGFDNPIENGLIASLARPGGNITGLSYSVGPDIFGKDIELLRDVVPDLQYLGVLSNPLGPNHRTMIKSVEVAALSLGVRLLLQEVRGPGEFDGAFDAAIKERVNAFFVFGDPMLGVHRARIAELAARHRLPAVYTNRLHVDAGGLMSYGPSFPDLWRRAAFVC
jgi:putative tryptophan/tyrosine transport system substrate-binding protein